MSSRVLGRLYLFALTGVLAFSLCAIAPAAPKGRNQIASFNLAPRGTSRDASLRVFRNTVEVIETFLYGQKGKKAAKAKGRRMWIDDSTFTITIVDTPDRIRSVSDFIRSLPYTASRSKEVVIPLKNVPSEEMASQLRDSLGASGGTAGQTPGGGEETTIRLRRGQEATFRDLRIRLRRVEENDENDDGDDSCELVLRTPTDSGEETIDEYLSVFFGDYEIVADDIRPSGTDGDGSVRLIVRYITPQTQQQGGNR